MTILHFYKQSNKCSLGEYNQRRRSHSKWRGTCPPQILSQVDFECSFQKTKEKKLPNNNFLYFIHSHQRDPNVQHSTASAAKFKSAFAGWSWARTDMYYSTAHYKQSHDSIEFYKCIDQSETFQMSHRKNFTPALTEFCSLRNFLIRKCRFA